MLKIHLYLLKKYKKSAIGTLFIKWWLQRELNQRHKDFQSSALPTELWSQMAVPTRIELAIFCVTGRRDNRYTTEPLVAGEGFEPTTFGLWARRATKLLHPAITKWRRKRDSNPCADYSTSWFSRPVPSTGLGYSSRHKKIITYLLKLCQLYFMHNSGNNHDFFWV